MISWFEAQHIISFGINEFDYEISNIEVPTVFHEGLGQKDYTGHQEVW